MPISRLHGVLCWQKHRRRVHAVAQISDEEFLLWRHHRFRRLERFKMGRFRALAHSQPIMKTANRRGASGVMAVVYHRQQAGIIGEKRRSADSRSLLESKWQDRSGA